MSLSTRRRDLSPSRSGGVGSSKLRMDRQPVVARITGTICIILCVCECSAWGHMPASCTLFKKKPEIVTPLFHRLLKLILF